MTARRPLVPPAVIVQHAKKLSVLHKAIIPNCSDTRRISAWPANVPGCPGLPPLPIAGTGFALSSRMTSLKQRRPIPKAATRDARPEEIRVEDLHKSFGDNA